MDTKQAITAAINLLGTIEVKGKENLDRLLASIILLENTRDALNQEGEKTDAADQHH